jgi:hypothetical protein
MKKFFKRLLFILLIVFVVLQFFRPKKNTSEGASTNDITKAYAVTTNVMTSLQTSCYDCHSNNTKYPWYSNIQPVAWWLADHIEEGKKEINFNEFAAYSPRRQYKKFKEINDQLEEDEMPLKSYTIIHGDAKLSKEQKVEIYKWTNSTMDSMKVKYPIDSLERPKKL